MFSPQARAEVWASAADREFDLLVVGLGATGAGVALDAASRGLTVLAVDKGDVASGTSSRSSKLVHGGLRYLETYQFGLVREGVRERQLLQRLAPQLVRRLDFLYPVWPDTAKRQLLRLGLAAYDAFSVLSGAAGSRHERLPSDEVAQRCPALSGSGAQHAFAYRDCVTDDARFVLAVVQAALRHGAHVLTYAEVTELQQRRGRVSGAELRHAHTGEVVRVRARHVVNATGAWVDGLQGMEQPGRAPAVQPSKGVHVVLPRHRLPLGDAAVLLPSRQGDGRSMFAIPWGEHTVLGTTDTLYSGPLDAVGVEETDVDYVLRAGSAVFGQPLHAADLVSGWAGVRPLIRQPGAASMSDVSRRHLVVEGSAGLLTITGGKLTTYRRMAQNVVDRIVARDGRRAACRTDRIPLGGTQSLDSIRGHLLARASSLGMNQTAAEALVSTRGEEARHVLDAVAAEPSLAEPLSAEAPHVLAEVVHAVRAEGARCLDDVYQRRTRVSLRARDAGLGSAPRAAELMARELGEDAAWAARQVAAYERAVKRERGAVGLPVPDRTSAVG